MPTNRRSRRSKRDRTGTAAAELAVCLPTIALLVLGSMEACNAIFLRHAINVAAYEGARVAIRDGATNLKVEDRCEAVLAARRVNSASINLSVANVSTVVRGNRIAVTISAPANANAISPAWFFGGRTVQGTCVMVKE